MRNELRYSGPIIGTLLLALFPVPRRLSGLYVCMYVGVTGNALPEDIAHFVAQGADEVVLKPLTKSKLLDAITRYMQL